MLALALAICAKDPGGNYYHASINDSIILVPTAFLAGPSGAVGVSSPDNPCPVVNRGEDYIFIACRLGSFRVVFKSRSSGSLQTDTMTIDVTDFPPHLEFASRSAEADVNRPFHFDMKVVDDGPDCVVEADLDGDGKVDCISKGEIVPTFRFSKPTLCGEKQREFTSYFKVTDNDGHSTRDSATLRILYHPPIAEAGENTIQCAEMVAKLSGAKSKDQNSDGYVTRFEWDLNGDGKGDTVTVTPEVEWVFHKPGDYCVVLKVTDNDGNVSLPDSTYVTVIREKPVANVVGPHECKVGETVILSGSAKASCGEIDRYLWDFEGTGNYEYVSRSMGRTLATYPKSGSYIARFVAVDSKAESTVVLWPMRILP